MNESLTTTTSLTCRICPHSCKLKAGQIGICGARTVDGDKVVATSYGKLTALSLDPIEKKPLARFFPGSAILSIGSYGCNLKCPFCQNDHIACARADKLNVPVREYSPNEVVMKALELRESGNIGIAYTYNEALINYEFVLDTSQQANEVGLKNVIVSNGYINEQPLLELLPYLDAANIDLKGFTQEFYDRVGAPRGLETVKRTIELIAAHKVHLEVTTLVIPGLNDSVEEIEQLAKWLAGISSQTPLHLSRFHPAHRMQDRTPTPHSTILNLKDVASKHLEHVYTGNM